MSTCCCLGPQNGNPVCRCMMGSYNKEQIEAEIYRLQELLQQSDWNKSFKY